MGSSAGKRLSISHCVAGAAAAATWGPGRSAAVRRAAAAWGPAARRCALRRLVLRRPPGARLGGRRVPPCVTAWGAVCRRA